MSTAHTSTATRPVSSIPEDVPQAGQASKNGKRESSFGSPSPVPRSSDHEGPPTHAVSFGLDMIDEKRISRPITRGAPGDAALTEMVKRDPQGTDLAKRKSQFYGQVFAYREPNVSIRNKIHQFSVITAEVKTNVIIKDEYVFLNDLSQHLSQRYHRPASSIFITLNHSACLLYAGTFDSAYIITITALPSQIQATTNKRNAALIQSFMTEALGVTSDRGILRFVGVAEEYLATNGTTVLAEIEHLSKTSSEDSTADGAKLGRSRSRRASKPVKSKDFLQQVDSRLASVAVPPSLTPMSPVLPPAPTEMSPLDRKAEKMQKIGKRKSLMALFGK